MKTPNYKAATKYFGDAAAEYEAVRRGVERWEREQQIVAEYIRGLPVGSEIADVPFGTGRFAPFYIEHKLQVFGADISADMITVAKGKIGDAPGFRIEVAPAEALPLADRSVDYLISHRFIKWLPDRAALKAVMAEFSRVTRREMFLQVKLTNPPMKKLNLTGRLVHALRRRRKPEAGKARTHEFSAREIERIIRANGFRIESVAHHPEISVGVVYYTIRRV